MDGGDRFALLSTTSTQLLSMPRSFDMLISDEVVARSAQRSNFDLTELSKRFSRRTR